MRCSRRLENDSRSNCAYVLTIDATAGGTWMNKTRDKAYNLIEGIA